MALGKAWRLGGFVAALGASGALIAATTGATGAYFNDTRSGTFAGTIGSVKINTSGGSGTDHLDFNFANLLPGTLQWKTVSYTVTGSAPEDVYVVFPNADALHAVNNMGSFGEVHVKSNGSGIFGSTNLNDGLDYTLQDDGHCGAQSPSGCWALPSVLKLASNVAPGHSGTMDFGFALASKWNDVATEGATAFCYPLVQNSANPSNRADQVCTSTSPQYGLPYQIVATQPGVAPNDPLNSNPTP